MINSFKHQRTVMPSVGRTGYSDRWSVLKEKLFTTLVKDRKADFIQWDFSVEERLGSTPTPTKTVEIYIADP